MYYKYVTAEPRQLLNSNHFLGEWGCSLYLQLISLLSLFIITFLRCNLNLNYFSHSCSCRDISDNIYYTAINSQKIGGICYDNIFPTKIRDLTNFEVVSDVLQKVESGTAS